MNEENSTNDFQTNQGGFDPEKDSVVLSKRNPAWLWGDEMKNKDTEETKKSETEDLNIGETGSSKSAIQAIIDDDTINLIRLRDYLNKLRNK